MLVVLSVHVRILVNLSIPENPLTFSNIRVVSTDEKNGEFFEGAGWVGGDEWIRAQFRYYLVCLLRTSLLPQEASEMHLYNSHFMSQLRQTKFHQSWSRDPPVPVLGLVPGGGFVRCQLQPE